MKDKNGINIKHGDTVRCYVNGLAVGVDDTVLEQDSPRLFLRYRYCTIEHFLSIDPTQKREVEVLNPTP